VSDLPLFALAPSAASDDAILEGLNDEQRAAVTHGEGPLLIVNASDIDFVNNPEDLENLINVVKSTRKGTHHYQPMSVRR